MNLSTKLTIPNKHRKVLLKDIVFAIIILVSGFELLFKKNLKSAVHNIKEKCAA